MTDSAVRPRTRSILGPLILIALGGLWLLGAMGLVSAGNVLAVLRYWPLLLIALGVDALLRWRWPILANVADVVFVALVVAAIVFAPQLGLSPSAGWLGVMPFVPGGRAGSGHVVTEERAVSDFNAVAFGSIGELAIQPGEQESLTIEAEDDVLSHIRTEVRGGTLYIGLDEPGTPLSVYPTRPIRFTLTVARLEAIDLSGAGNVTASGPLTGHLSARLSGAGGLALSSLDLETLVVDLSGAGSLSAAGTADRLEVGVSGFGSFNGADLQSTEAEVTLRGFGSATVWATSRLTAAISGVGSVTYYGEPSVTKTVSSLGTVRAAGNR
jgi:hypothetical protein